MFLVGPFLPDLRAVAYAAHLICFDSCNVLDNQCHEVLKIRCPQQLQIVKNVMQPWETVLNVVLQGTSHAAALLSEDVCLALSELKQAYLLWREDCNKNNGSQTTQLEFRKRIDLQVAQLVRRHIDSSREPCIGCIEQPLTLKEEQDLFGVMPVRMMLVFRSAIDKFANTITGYNKSFKLINRLDLVTAEVGCYTRLALLLRPAEETEIALCSIEVDKLADGLTGLEESWNRRIQGKHNSRYVKQIILRAFGIQDPGISTVGYTTKHSYTAVLDLDLITSAVAGKRVKKFMERC
ncbi:MAG: hypothetical protein RLZZ453_128 [Chlamydiota bacterium]|jgi:hypothetical protein